MGGNAQNVNSDKTVVNKWKTIFLEYGAALGIVPGVALTKDQYVKNFAALAEKEIAKAKNGEGCLLIKLKNALFDLGVTNHDGTISFEEYRAVVGIVEFPKSYVEEIFKAIDTNKNGKLERKELNDFEFKLWYGLDEEKGRNSLDSVLSNK